MRTTMAVLMWMVQACRGTMTVLVFWYMERPGRYKLWLDRGELGHIGWSKSRKVPCCETEKEATGRAETKRLRN